MEPTIWTAAISTAITVFVSLLVTFIFNKVSGMPAEIKKQKKEQQQKITNLETRIETVEEAVSHYPEYRAQSLRIQRELQCKDESILSVCEKIEKIGQKLDERLIELERREKNSLRAKILNEYRLYTDERKNPMLAWTEMEHHSFFKLVEDYESLGGNDYVHGTIIPAMNELDVIPMDRLTKIKELYDSRTIK